MNTDSLQRKKPELTGYVIGIYGLAGPDQVTDFFNRLRNWYGVEHTVIMCYRPEMHSLAFGCTPHEFLKLVEYALPMMFMQDYIHHFKVDAVYEPKRCVQIRCYNRDENGRRYRWFKYKYGDQQTVYIDPEPQPVEVAQAA